MLDWVPSAPYTAEQLLEVLRILRDPENGCPWDKVQTHASIRKNFLEETCEVLEAIDADDPAMLREELGDVLLQVVFHTQMEKEKGVFDMDDVADGICKKLIFRHPHIFGDVTVGSTDEILSNWDDLKRKEKKQETDTSTLESVSKSLPSLIRAQKLQKKAAKVGFDWPDVSGALDKVEEELAEVRAAIGGDGDVEEEIGDLIFAVTNVSRFVKVDSERAAEKTCNKFVRRFADMEQQAKAQGRQLSELTLEEMDALWDEAKKKEHRE